MRNYYRACLVPLEAYHFSTENNFWSKIRQSKSVTTPYYVASEHIPNQTTLLGMLRYKVLKQYGKLGMSVPSTERDPLIGPASFDYFSPIVQEFGKIINLSSLFITDDSGGIYFPKPNNLYFDEGVAKYYCHHREDNQSYLTKADGNSFKAKDHSSGGYCCLDKDGKLSLASELFRVKSKVRVNKQERLKNQGSDDAFFKMEMVTLETGYQFEFFVTFSSDFIPTDDIVFLGTSQSAFHLTFKKVTADDSIALFKTLGQVLSLGNPEAYDYAFSDVVLPANQLGLGIYGILSKRYFRNLTTVYQNNRYQRFKPNSGGQLYEAGSVFYAPNPELVLPEDAQLKTIGLNHIIRIEKGES